jgi:hypothetical protein
VTLRTNDRGEIRLGRLENVRALSAQTVDAPQIGSIPNTWNISTSSKETFYQSEYHLIVNQEFSLPLSSNFNIEKDLELVRLNEDGYSVISNEKKTIHVKNNRLTTKFEQTGQFKLIFNHINQTIMIRVIEGKVWEEPNQIYN